MYDYHQYEIWKNLIQDMKVPKFCDPNWFIDHGHINNKNHSNFNAALKFAKQLTRRTRWDI